MQHILYINDFYKIIKKTHVGLIMYNIILLTELIFYIIEQLVRYFHLDMVKFYMQFAPEPTHYWVRC